MAPRKTTARKSSARRTATKPAARKSTPVKPAAVATPAPVTDSIVTSESSTENLALKKKELIDLVVERSGIKRKDAKPAVEAALEVLGEALGKGQDLNLRPLGKVMIKQTKELDNAKVLVCRVRQPKATAPKAAPSSIAPDAAE